MSNTEPDAETKAALIRRRLRQLEKEARETTKDIESSKKPNFRGDVIWASVRQLRSHRDQILAQTHQLRSELLELEDRSKQELDAADMTPEEWIDYHAEIARRLDVPELEPYVQAWAQRHGAMIVMEGGLAQLRYRQTG